MKGNVGQLFPTNKGCDLKIIEVKNNKEILIEFQDQYKFRKITQKKDIVQGSVKNPFTPCVYGVGFLGSDPIVGKDRHQAYGVWKCMIERCYVEDFKDYNSPVYVGCTMAEDWLNFTTYEKWHREHYVEGFEIDKDILIRGNKIYGPDTCRFVPAHINTLLFTNQERKESDLPMGVNKVHKKYRARLSKQGKRVNIGYFNKPEEAYTAYIKARKDYIQEVADEWKGKIKSDVYKSLISWEF